MNRHSEPPHCLSSLAADRATPAIHHFPLILSNDHWWRRTNESDFLSVFSTCLNPSYIFSSICTTFPRVSLLSCSPTKYHVKPHHTLSLFVLHPPHPSQHIYPSQPSFLSLLYFILFPVRPSSAQRSIKPMGSEKPPHATLLIVTSSLLAGCNLSSLSAYILLRSLQIIMALHLFVIAAATQPISVFHHFPGITSSNVHLPFDSCQCCYPGLKHQTSAKIFPSVFGLWTVQCMCVNA